MPEISGIGQAVRRIQWPEGVAAVSAKFRRLFVHFRQEGPLPVLLPAVAVLAALALFFHFVNGRIWPALEAAATSQATNLMTQAINAAVDDCLEQNGMGYADFVIVETDTVGKVTSLTSNTAQTNRFKRLVTDAIIQRIGEMDPGALGVPLGTLTGQALLSGVGPSVRVRVDSVGSVTVDYSNSFTEAGLNQTLHRICLDVDATAYLFLPGKILPVSVSSSICVAETVIVGEAPDTYLNLKGNG